ncbi:hypothetical protein [Hymenobacter weizhouensis]|uniref:hypothetical protein n=1 Tax=Hymenobacter sp. YIM 151500-1 TaxID=2987689 RepID=UPI0022274564|nr:hypothetical protein [Hymenobacter sp. YIM 151500-1]UYZ64299.1 hypothetical protein OIS53_05475 [Hymenobacter sp. YIM 151500-1]
MKTKLCYLLCIGLLFGCSKEEAPQPVTLKQKNSQHDYILPGVTIVGSSPGGGTGTGGNLPVENPGGGGGTGPSGRGPGGYEGPTYNNDPGGGWAGTDPNNVVLHIITGQSISDNEKADCILSKLKSNSQFMALLANFQNTARYNVEFSLDELPNGWTGITRWSSSNNTAQIKIDKSILEYQHAIWGATTFFHEAFHANLQQYAISTFGTFTVSNWPKSINDMNLQELASYIESTSQSSADWVNATHQFMAVHNNIIAEGMRTFVQANYPRTYAEIGGDIEIYKYLALMGLEETKYFKDEIESRNKTNHFEQAINRFLTTELQDCTK